MLARALNHVTAPGLRWDAVLELAASLGCVGVEFRNDLDGPLFAGDAPEAVKAGAAARGLRVLGLSEVKAFNDWSEAKRTEAEALMRIAVACGAETVSLIPRNDGLGMGNGERQANLRVALRALAPMLEAHGLVGLVEPLGFETSSLRMKVEAVAAIEALGAADRFKVVHDTFHHHLSGENALFAEHTGIVHVSGVTDPGPATGEMQDAHRVLVGRGDRLGNIAQLRALQAAGYAGPISVEAFSPEVQALADPGPALQQSFSYIAEELAKEAA